MRGREDGIISVELLHLVFPNADLRALQKTSAGEVKIIYPVKRSDFSGLQPENFGNKKYRGNHRTHTHGLYAVRFTGLQRRRKRNI